MTETGNEESKLAHTLAYTHAHGNECRDTDDTHIKQKHVNSLTLRLRNKTCATKAHSLTNHIY